MKEYEALLHYGYQRSHDTYETYHSFELADADDKTDCAVIARELAESLDTTPEDEDFNWNSMLVRLPDSLVRKIQEDAACTEDAIPVSFLRNLQETAKEKKLQTLWINGAIDVLISAWHQMGGEH